ncbi:hypothetical protein BJY00DRAFT_286794 [Aspergillus carlsbadensis]|nr:hypothetical protein BJY00DRAFT_286794 [Aspergillus carlsbadensis]
MSQQNGVPSSLASIAAHPTDGTAIRPAIIPNSHPSNPSASAFRSLSTVSTSSNPSRPRTIIPKLSAATTELLARLAGNIRGSQPHQQQTLLENDKTPSSRNSFPVGTSNRNIQGVNAQRARTMRVSSIFIDLPTPPFVYPTSVDVETPVVTTIPSSIPAPAEPFTAQPSTGSSPKPSSLASVAPKPVATPSTPAYVTPQVPTQVQPPAVPQPPSLPLLAPLVPAPTTSTPSNSSVPRAVSAKTVKPASAPRQRAVAGSRKSLSKKRKRGKGSDGEDVIRAGDSSSDESDFTPTATQTKSGRQVNRPSLYVPEPVIPALPKEDINPLGPSEKPQDVAKKRRRVSRKGKTTNTTCRHCQRGHSAPRNVIVFCDRCNRAWHQHCHDPPIERDVITVKEKEWLCQECNPVNINILHPTVVRSNPSLTWKHPIFVPIPPPKAEVGGERFPTLDRRQFLSGLSHATLVELLLSVSDKHPTVPMFPENMASLPVSKFPSSQTTTNNSTSANPTSFAAGNGAATLNPDAPQQRPRGRYQEESSDEESEYEFQEHRLYPRAGNGVRLSALAEDLDILAEDPGCPTFSYTLHGPMQASIAGRVSA